MTEIYNLDLDEELLSHLPDPDAWLILRGENFSPELIEDSEIAEIYEWQDKHLRQEGQPATASVLSDEFDIGFEDPLTAVGDLIDRMRERYMKNSGRKVLEGAGKLFQERPLAVPKYLAEEGRRLQYILTKHGEMYGNGDYDRLLRQYGLKVERGPGSSLGFEEVDHHFYGQHGLTFVVAPPKTYKSWFEIKMLWANIVEGKHAWIYSLELPSEETHQRLLCLVADVPWWHYLQNCISPREEKRRKEAAEMLDGLGVYKIGKPEQGKRGIDELIGNARDAGADIVLIDQLQYVEGPNGHSLGEMNDTGQYWGVLDRARNLSDEGPICFAHQFNRSTMNADQMPSIQQAKGSSAIEETATLALGLWANKDMRRSNVVELGTLISRNYNYESWEMGVELSHGCSFNILRKIDDDTEE